MKKKETIAGVLCSIILLAMMPLSGGAEIKSSECALCGDDVHSVLAEATGSDSVGVLYLNDPALVDMGIGSLDENGGARTEPYGVMRTSSMNMGGMFSFIQILPDNRYATFELDLSNPVSILDEVSLLEHYCPACVAKLLALEHAEDGAQRSAFALVDYQTGELGVLSECNLSFSVGDYRMFRLHSTKDLFGVLVIYAPAHFGNF